MPLPSALRARWSGKSRASSPWTTTPKTLRHVRDALSRAGYVPIVTGDPREALLLLQEQAPHLVLLDLALPGADGIEFMAEIGNVADVPVIFLSAYGREENVTQALDQGAVDYIVKPFSPMELAARIRAALRKREAPEPPATYVLEDLTIRYADRMVLLAGRPVRLTSVEYRVLAELALNAGRVLSHEHLLQHIWGKEPESEAPNAPEASESPESPDGPKAPKGPDIRPMRTAISSIRRKLGDHADHPTYIFTEPRIGYWMPPTPESDEPEDA